MTRPILSEGARIHARYDVIWVGNFGELRSNACRRIRAKALQEAVEAGSGFIHTGGESSFHGTAELQPAMIEATT